jgi:tRNA (guanine-N7-)-methyltransferase
MSPAEFKPADYFRLLTREEIFPHHQGPLEIDLGCGEGSFLLAMAKAHPERCFLGVERLKGRVAKVAKKIQQAGIQNCRILRLESAYTVAWLLPSASVSRLHLLCPDPWPKKKHHRRRLILDPEFNEGLERILEPQGHFLLKTDDADYYEAGTTHCDALPWLARQDWPEEAFYYPQTDFERIWLRSGRSIHRARWTKVGD